MQTISGICNLRVRPGTPNMRLNLRVRGVTIPQPPGMDPQMFSPALRKIDLAGSILRRRKMPIRLLPPLAKNNKQSSFGKTDLDLRYAIAQRASGTDKRRRC